MCCVIVLWVLAFVWQFSSRYSLQFLNKKFSSCIFFSKLEGLTKELARASRTFDGSRLKVDSSLWKCLLEELASFVQLLLSSQRQLWNSLLHRTSRRRRYWLVLGNTWRPISFFLFKSQVDGRPPVLTAISQSNGNGQTLSTHRIQTP